MYMCLTHLLLPAPRRSAVLGPIREESESITDQLCLSLSLFLLYRFKYPRSQYRVCTLLNTHALEPRAHIYVYIDRVLV